MPVVRVQRQKIDWRRTADGIREQLVALRDEEYELCEQHCVDIDTIMGEIEKAQAGGISPDVK